MAKDTKLDWPLSKDGTPSRTAVCFVLTALPSSRHPLHGSACRFEVAKYFAEYFGQHLGLHFKQCFGQCFDQHFGKHFDKYAGQRLSYILPNIVNS